MGQTLNPFATKQAVDEDGWLNTGDIGWICPHHSRGRSRQAGGVIVLEGRAKDTIVLSTGENVEPAEIEEAALRSRLIQQIMVIGQDQRRLAAIIVPDKEEILLDAKRLSMVEVMPQILVSKNRLICCIQDRGEASSQSSHEMVVEQGRSNGERPAPLPHQNSRSKLNRPATTKAHPNSLKNVKNFHILMALL